METLDCLPVTHSTQQIAAPKRNRLNGFLKAIAATGLIAAGVATSVVFSADSAAACGRSRSRCVTVRPVCIRSCGVGAYARPLYFPRSYPAYPTYYRR